MDIVITITLIQGTSDSVLRTLSLPDAFFAETGHCADLFRDLLELRHCLFLESSPSVQSTCSGIVQYWMHPADPSPSASSACSDGPI